LLSAVEELVRYDLARRENRRENRHLGFGPGSHFCLGAAPARLEMRLGRTRLLERLPSLKLATDALEWRSGSMLRGLRVLPVRF
jgi:hypothetical protein